MLAYVILMFFHHPSIFYLCIHTYITLFLSCRIKQLYIKTNLWEDHGHIIKNIHIRQANEIKRIVWRSKILRMRTCLGKTYIRCVNIDKQNGEGEPKDIFNIPRGFPNENRWHNKLLNDKPRNQCDLKLSHMIMDVT